MGTEQENNSCLELFYPVTITLQTDNLTTKNYSFHYIFSNITNSTHK